MKIPLLTDDDYFNEIGEFPSPGKPGSQEAMKTPLLTDYRFQLEFYATHASPEHRPCIRVFLFGELYGVLSTNVPKYPLTELQFFAKTYSENLGWADKLLRHYSNYFTKTNRKTHSGFVYLTAYQITPEFIRDQFEATYNRSADIYTANPILWRYYDTYVEKQPS